MTNTSEPKWLSPEQARGVWRVEIALRIRELWHRLLEASATAFPTGEESGAPAKSAVWDSHFSAAEDALMVANGAITLPSQENLWQRWWSGIKEWWTGVEVTAAWESVHSAEAELVEIGGEDDVRSSLPRLWSWMQQVMTESERAVYKERMEAMLTDDKAPVDLALIRAAYQDVIRANNDMHICMRSFRNTLFLVSGGLLVLLLAAGIWHAINPSFMSFCTSAGKCPGGGRSPSGQTVFEIELVGALGGLLATAFLIGKFNRAPTRYNLLSGQLVLKPVAGAAAGVLAILFLQSGLIVSSSSDTSSITVLLGYAALFGFSQELLTRLVDKRADAIIEEQGEGKGKKGKANS